MSDTKWAIHGREFTNCNCAYGCPCQFNALPTHGFCQAVVGIQIDKGFHGETSLDGLRVAGIFRWPGPIHLGNGEAMPIIDVRANDKQREALLRIMSGQDTAPGATIFPGNPPKMPRMGRLRGRGGIVIRAPPEARGYPVANRSESSSAW